MAITTKLDAVPAPQAPAALPTDPAALLAMLAAAQAQIAALQAKHASKAPTLKVSRKGCVSVYGLGRFPVSLYPSQWERITAETFRADLAAFVAKHGPEISARAAAAEAADVATKGMAEGDTKSAAWDRAYTAALPATFRA